LREGLRGRVERTGLFLLGPAASLLADPRMGGEGLAPVLAAEASPDRVGFFLETLEILERPAFRHAASPRAGATAGEERLRRLIRRQCVEALEIHRTSPARVP